MADFFKLIGVAVASAAVLAVLAGAVIGQLVKRDQQYKVGHNRRYTDRTEAATPAEEAHDREGAHPVHG